MLPYLAISACSGSKPGAAIANGDLKNPSKIRLPGILRTFKMLQLNQCVRCLLILTSLQLILGIFCTRDKQSVRF